MEDDSVLHAWLKTKEKEILQRFDREVVTTEDMLVLILKAHIDAKSAPQTYRSQPIRPS